jgi:hypothetical protein
MTSVAPPLRPPIFNDAIGGREEISPEDTFCVLCHRLSTALAFDGPWLVKGWLVTLVSRQQPADTEPLEAKFRVEKDATATTATLHISIDPSGWIEARVAVEGFGARRFFIEQAYEEFEIWPPGSPCTAIDSGRMGKNCGWLQLEAEFWPDLALLADGRFVTLDPRDPDR